MIISDSDRKGEHHSQEEPVTVRLWMKKTRKTHAQTDKIGTDTSIKAYLCAKKRKAGKRFLPDFLVSFFKHSA